jgi:rhodanese-related sulfurtransferase
MKWFQRAEVWEIGPFQLENLMANRGGHLLFDLSKVDSASEAEAVAALLADRIAVDFGNLETTVADKVTDLGHPVILICEKGEDSTRAARRLMALNYTNVYVVSGGFEALRAYFAESNGR